MKPTINVNIGGFAFNIEKDAHTELEAYLKSVRDANACEGSACDEICSEIEGRIGELLIEKCRGERVVALWMVRDVKKVIGEFGTDGGTADEGSGTADGAGTGCAEGQGNTKEPPKKRLMRDIDNRYVGGVCSGLAAFTGLDVVIYRLVFCLMFAAVFLDRIWSGNVAGLALLAYIVLWICIPAARTVEQKCQLSGKPISKDDFTRRANDMKQDARRSFSEARSELRTAPAVHAASRVFLVVIGVILVLSGAAGLIGCAFTDMIAKLIHTSVEDADVTGIVDTIFSTKILISLLAAVILWCIWKIYAGTLLVLNLNAPKWRPGLVILAAALVSMITFCVLAGRAALSLPMTV